MRVLLVEDDSELAGVIEHGLTEHAMDVVREATFSAGQSRATLGTFDIIILDVMLPGGSGFDLCRALRKRGVGAPVLMLTARDAVDDRVQGLDAGADDYLSKPFAFRELVARLHALARRRPTPLPEVATVADLEVDLRAHRVRRAGREIELTGEGVRAVGILRSACRAGRGPRRDHRPRGTRITIRSRTCSRSWSAGSGEKSTTDSTSS